MSFVRGLLDRTVLVLAIIAAGCVPSFIGQYQERIGGRLEQAERDLAPFQAIANRSHGGSLEALIQYHLASSDRTFHEEGQAIQQMVDAVAYLKDTLQRLDTDLFHQVAFLIVRHDPQTVTQTWSTFQPSFTLTLESASFALLAGLLIWMVFVALWYALAGGQRTPVRDHLSRRH